VYLQNLTLFNFKNYSENSYTFSPHINCIVGENGVGKTNLLDAIHYLCLTKSAFSSIDSQHIKHKETFFMLQGSFSRQEKNYQIDCSVQIQKPKIFRNNKKEYDKLALHIGEFPCTLMMPYDTDLIREGSEIRRKFFDNMISQAKPLYLQNLMQYNQLLKQRNSTLQYFAEKNTFDKDLLDSYNTPLLKLNQLIFEDRQYFSSYFMPLLQKYYEFIVNGKELATVDYVSDLQNENFNSLFTNNLQKDLAAQRTTLGIHKDDYIFNLDNLSVSKFASQGQQKSYVIALRLAQNALIAKHLHEQPILLLDDIFDKLDEKRIIKLLQFIDNQHNGQVFITDARPERSRNFMQGLARAVNMIILD
jgi:DNA replication and repair protein RecF